jgi:aspartate-semialdehyde dehydrogenase
VPLPERFANIVVRRCIPSDFSDCKIIFLSLNSDVVGEVETAFLEANFAVFSNAKNHQLALFIPLVVPTVNLGILD